MGDYESKKMPTEEMSKLALLSFFLKIYLTTGIDNSLFVSSLFWKIPQHRFIKHAKIFLCFPILSKSNFYIEEKRAIVVLLPPFSQFTLIIFDLCGYKLALIGQSE